MQSSCRKRIQHLSAVAPALILMGLTLPAGAFQSWDTLTKPTPIEHERFGVSIAVDGTTAVVSAPGRLTYPLSDLPGRVMVYELNGSYEWELAAILTDASSSDGDAFGSDVAIDGDKIVVGARNMYNGSNERSGGALVYNKPATGWESTDEPDAVLQPNTLSGGDWFGAAVAIDGDCIMVGCPMYDTIGSENIGAVYPYVYNSGSGTWTQGTLLTAPTPILNEHFGMTIDIDNGFAAIGAPNLDVHDDPGSVHIYEFTQNNTWSLFQALDDRQGEQDGDHFGRALDFWYDDGTETQWLFVGASGDTDPGNASGDHRGSVTAYALDNGSFVQQQTLWASDGDEGDHFGFSIDVLGGTMIVGAIWEEYGGMGKVGAAYRFTIDANDDWSQQSKFMLSQKTAQDVFGYATGVFPLSGSAVGALISTPDWDDSTLDDVGAVAVITP